MSLRYLLDTSTLSHATGARRDRNLIERLASSTDECAIASVVWHELWYGCRRMATGRNREELERFLERVVGLFNNLPYDAAAADWHATERARQSLSGTLAPYLDSQIAAVAATNGLVVVTVNVKDFEGRFAGLAVENWLASV